MKTRHMYAAILANTPRYKQECWFFVCADSEDDARKFLRADDPVWRQSFYMIAYKSFSGPIVPRRGFVRANKKGGLGSYPPLTLAA